MMQSYYSSYPGSQDFNQSPGPVTINLEVSSREFENDRVEDRTSGKRKRRYTRSRAGCINCRTKKIKCDEMKPVCGRCANGDVCTWPAVEIEQLERKRPRKDRQENVWQCLVCIAQGRMCDGKLPTCTSCQLNYDIDMCRWPNKPTTRLLLSYNNGYSSATLAPTIPMHDTSVAVYQPMHTMAATNVAVEGAGSIAPPVAFGVSTTSSRDTINMLKSTDRYIPVLPHTPSPYYNNDTGHQYASWIESETRFCAKTAESGPSSMESAACADNLLLSEFTAASNAHYFDVDTSFQSTSVWPRAELPVIADIASVTKSPSQNEAPKDSSYLKHELRTKRYWYAISASRGASTAMGLQEIDVLSPVPVYSNLYCIKVLV